MVIMGIKLKEMFNEGDSGNMVIQVWQGADQVLRIEAGALVLTREVVNTLAEAIGDALGLARSKEPRR